jgi:hemerythrin-like domain-containing protein
MTAVTRSPSTHQLLNSPGAAFHAPFEMLLACHDRVLRMLGLMERLLGHIRSQGADRQARDAARDLIRYFDLAAPAHHEDEERHLLPRLRTVGQGELADQLQREHQAMNQAWRCARESLTQVAEGRCTPQVLERASADWPRLQDLYGPHVELENSVAYGVARASMDDEQREAMGREMAQRRGVAYPEMA